MIYDFYVAQAVSSKLLFFTPDVSQILETTVACINLLQLIIVQVKKIS